MRLDIIDIPLKNRKDLATKINLELELQFEAIYQSKTYWLEEESQKNISQNLLHSLLRDPIDQKILGQEIAFRDIDFDYIAEISFKPGVTDNTARSVLMALSHKLTHSPTIASGQVYLLKTKHNKNEIEMMAKKFLYNPLIQRVQIYQKNEFNEEIPSLALPTAKLQSKGIETINFDRNDESLLQLSKDRLWALSLTELKEIKSYFNSSIIKKKRQKQGLPQNPTDVEIEIIAQTWSEHCKHKIFNAEIDYQESPNIDKKLGPLNLKSIFKEYIKASTEKINCDWLVSVFSDNAGIVRFDESVDFCLKVETHNSPSALDPYGGALTGILGVNRDILGCGLGAKPIANTNVLCFAHSSLLKEKKLPPKLMHPEHILKGVHKGIEDGGNKSGIPTVNGAIFFHDNYAGKPLVYCGTVGVLPQKVGQHPSHLKRHRPGDYIVICGGSVGADGIHGATFSSLELNDDAPSTAVQIGDPFTQKRLSDFVIEARDKNLFNSITDNGAGGLSSSVGEMAEHTNGASIDVSKVPLKYSGLSPFEIVISESQERMTFSVSPECLEEFIKLAKKRECNPAVIGNFHDRGSFDIYEKEELISSLELEFLHDSLPAMKLKAFYEDKKTNQTWTREVRSLSQNNLSQDVLTLLSHPNIRSKEQLVRQFDHEVQAATIIKPFLDKKQTGPSDAAVLWSGRYGGHKDGAISISCGLCPEISHLDTYLMTQLAIDEAIRNAICSGTNPDFIALCDNYCWPDPIESPNNLDGPHKLAQLVRSAKALYDTALIYKTPFISGKDSMKNDFIGKSFEGNQVKISVPPTLLITALGKLDTKNDVMTTDFKHADDLVYYLGEDCFNELSFSTLHPQLHNFPTVHAQKNRDRYKKVHALIKRKIIKSAHDISDGGLITSLCESLFPQKLGFTFTNNFLKENESLEAFLFNEYAGGILVSISMKKQQEFERFLGEGFRLIGKTNSTNFLEYKKYFSLEINSLYQAWSDHDY
ncbi:MAG: phosphoribosylformylglycinamidine synthase [Halobacteriovoraceae bacterium]|nr:phosphoribosylformylglycinamidine synthase [Halobacteriovoraceae bacterium]